MVARSWTMKELAHAIKLRQGGYKVATIALLLNRSTGSVSCRLLKSGVAKQCHKWRKSGRLAAAVRRVCLPGVSDLDAAKRLRVGRELVYRTRKRLGIPPGVPRGAQSRPRAQKKRPDPPPECWTCGVKAKRCCRGRSLTDQGWWWRISPDSRDKEVYCSGCVRQYGTPETWGVGR